MKFDELQNKWQSQQSNFKLSIETNLLLKEVQRNKRYFEAMIFWRDVREVTVGAVVSVFLAYFALKHDLWPLLGPVAGTFFVIAFLLIDRVLQRKKEVCTEVSLKSCTENTLLQVNHQTWLLLNVFWWYLLPPGVGIVFFCAWIIWHITYWTIWALVPFGTVAFYAFVCIGCYWLNQYEVRKELLPRKHELEQLLTSLENNIE